MKQKNRRQIKAFVADLFPNTKTSIMIVETMTHAEVYAELERDFQNIGRWMEQSYKYCRRYALKQNTKRFPIVLVDNYTSPRRIQYGLVVILFRRGESDFAHYTYTLRQTKQGKEVYLCKTYEESKVPKVVFIPHAIKRYAERMNVKRDVEYEDIVRSMLIRTLDCMASRNQRIGSKSVRYKGDMLITLCTRDGAFLGKVNGDIFVVNTFITYDMMSGLQADELTKHRDAFMRGIDAADELILKFNNRKTIRSNQPIKKIP